MKKSAEDDADNFWVYNNGITILTHKLVSATKNKIVVRGLSVINGAQTTGVLSKVEVDDAKQVSVPCRIVECTEDSVIADIIAFNNTQNEMKSFDLRSRDDVQRKLREEFDQEGIRYVHRRGASRRFGPAAIHAAVVAPALAAFHDKFQIAIRQRAEIFEQDTIYNDVFPAEITAEHVYLVQCLADGLDLVKRRLKEDVKGGEPTGLAAERFELMDHSTSKYFLIFVVGAIVEQLVGHRVTDKHAWRCRDGEMKPDRKNLTLAWEDVLERILPRIAKLVRSDAKAAVRSTSRGEEVAEELAEYLESNRDDMANSLAALRAVSTFDARPIRQPKAVTADSSSNAKSPPKHTKGSE